jgi:endonuclease/exonuclease/phosphatase (EEP) superfamily protein YafD
LNVSDSQPANKHRKAGAWLWRLYEAFAVVMVLYLVISQSVGNALWPITVLAFVAILLFPIAFVMLPIAIARRRWFGVVLQLICVFAFILVLIDTRSLNQTAIAPPGAPTLTVMTYNLGDGMASADRLVTALASEQPEIVALVEVTEEMAEAIDQDLSGQYPYQVLRGDGISGKGFLSTWPITDYEWLEFNPGRPDLRVEIDIDGQAVTVVVAHPPPPEVTRSGVQDRRGTRAQMDALLALVNANEGPLLLLGDFNITRQHNLYDEIAATGLIDVFHTAGKGFGFTLPARLQHLGVISDRLADVRILPVVRIDYIWASDHWLPLDARVGPDAGSDHLPVIGRMALLPPGP